ncbi:MAG: 6-carboxytetrahydropterin synthase [Bryobacterales bacterium]|nr:6-carboxytetrahydropterin synthase [Bryobacterales bacterium]
MLITRKAEFSASHVCFSPDLSPERNTALFGEESRPHGHGHNFVLEVTVRGDVDPVHGMVLDLKHLKRIIRDRVLDVYDHRFLNREVPPFDKVVPTAENIARDIWERLQEPIGSLGAALHSVRLHESHDLFVEYQGGSGR